MRRLAISVVRAMDRASSRRNRSALVTNRCQAAKAVITAGLLFLAIGVPLDAAADDISDLKRALKELQEQNRALANRIATLEAARSRGAQKQGGVLPAQEHTAAQAAPTVSSVPPTSPPPSSTPAQQTQAAASPPRRPDRGSTSADLEQRVRELELNKVAQEDATRSIIRSSLAKSGPRINEFISLGGNIEVLAGRTQDFTGLTQTDVILNTAELDLDIKASPWATGSFILAFDPGTGNTIFPTTQGGTSAGGGVDRLTVDRAMVTLGDPLRFPFFAMFGRDVIPFGVSTGVTRTSGLSIESPLTIQIFETRSNWIGIGFEYPTPELTRPPPPVVVPPVQPLVVGPLVNKFAHWVGFQPSTTRPVPLAPTAAPPARAPFYGGINFFEGNDLIGSHFDFSQNYNATLGYRAAGHCGRPYSELTNSLVCPWSFDMSVDFTSSVYSSNFLQLGYGAFLSQIGRVPGIAASVKGSFGPFALIAEYNGALARSSFIDGLGNTVNMQPAAWQASLGYQFGWNPWVEKIGDQGTFVAIGYSGSQDMAGATQIINGQPTRAGFTPQSRLIMTASEWVLESVKLTFEASVDWDYPISAGGTSATGNSFLMGLSYSF